jgi:hypothetical protein
VAAPGPNAARRGRGRRATLEAAPEATPRASRGGWGRRRASRGVGAARRRRQGRWRGSPPRAGEGRGRAPPRAGEGRGAHAGEEERERERKREEKGGEGSSPRDPTLAITVSKT